MARPKQLQDRFRKPSLACAAGLLTVMAADPAHAQGSRLESFFNDAQRFLEKQGRALERELQDLSGPTTRPPRPSVGIGRPPLPKRNPQRPPPPKPVDRAQEAPQQSPATTAQPSQPAPTPEAPPTPRPAAPPETAENPVAANDEPDAPVAALVPLPERNPLLAEGSDEAPKLPPHPREIDAADWTEEQIAQAKEACAAALEGLSARYVPLPPIREGQCGAPSPISLSSIGSEPAVTISPPATLTCGMAVALNRWLSEQVQPAAREKLASPVVSLRNVASYVCRTRYNTPGKRISEHALANALDISAFTTEAGETVTLITSWIRDEAVESGDKEASATPVQAQPAGGDFDPAAKPPGQKTEPAAVAETKSEKTAAEPAEAEKPSKEASPPREPDPKDLFLRAVHAGACEIFGTVLGPNANASHHDHFHLDMKERSNGGHCE